VRHGGTKWVICQYSSFHHDSLQNRNVAVHRAVVSGYRWYMLSVASVIGIEVNAMCSLNTVQTVSLVPTVTEQAWMAAIQAHSMDSLPAIQYL
jgi:hypothetical protein